MPITDNLIVHYKLNEASGTREDSHSNNYDLAPSNTPGSAAGKIGDAVQLVRASSQSLSVASNTDLQTGDVNYEISLWVNLTSKPAIMELVGKSGGLSGGNEWTLTYNSTVDRFQFQVYRSDSTAHAVNADNLGSPSTGTWYYIHAWHDASANTINIQVNNGSVNSTGYSAGQEPQAANTRAFMLGNRAAGSTRYLDGLLDSLSFWKGRVLSSGERTSMYGAGSGLDYPFTVQEERSLAGSQPASSGVLGTDPDQARFTGSQPAASGVLSTGANTLTSLTGTQPSPTGGLTFTHHRSRSLAGSQPSSSGVLVGVPILVRNLTGSQPTSTGVLRNPRLVTLQGAVSAPFGILTKLVLETFEVEAAFSLPIELIADLTPEFSGANALQVIHIADAGGGTFTLTYSGQTTSAIAWNASAATIQSSLEALSNLSPGDVVVSGGPGAELPLAVQFAGTLAETAVGVITADDSGLTGPPGSTPRVATQVLVTGHSELEDYGTHDELRVTILGSRYEYQGSSLNLSLGRADQVGDEQASFKMFIQPPYPGKIPNATDTVILSDKQGGHWIGRIEAIHTTVTDRMVELTVTARGFFTATHDHIWEDERKFALGTSVQRIVQDCLNSLCNHAILGTPAYMTAGNRVLPEESQSQQGKDAAATIDEFTILGDTDDSPLSYRVGLPSDRNATWPVFYLDKQQVAATHRVWLRDGATLSLDWDLQEIINEYLVMYGTDEDDEGITKVTHATSPAQLNSLVRQKLLSNSGFPTVGEARDFARVLLRLHGDWTSVGDTITVPHGVPIEEISSGQIIPAWRVPVNSVFEIPDRPTLEDGFPPVNLRITKTQWTQDNNQGVFTTGNYSELKRLLRKLVGTEEQRGTDPLDPSGIRLIRDPQPPVPVTYGGDTRTGGGDIPALSGHQHSFESQTTIPIILPTKVGEVRFLPSFFNILIDGWMARSPESAVFECHVLGPNGIDWTLGFTGLEQIFTLLTQKALPEFNWLQFTVTQAEGFSSESLGVTIAFRGLRKDSLEGLA
jgi:hypothetical protein